MADTASYHEELIKSIIESVYRELGDNADPEQVRRIVRKTLDEIENNRVIHAGPDENSIPSVPMSSNRIIVTAFGKNKPGVVAAISERLAQTQCNIEDISQKILQEFFAMILIVDIRDCTLSLRQLKDELGEIGNRLGIRVLAQHEDVFNYMHRL